MRQAGRFLREYREARSRVSFKEFCKTPDMASEITLMVVDPLRRGRGHHFLRHTPHTGTPGAFP